MDIAEFILGELALPPYRLATLTWDQLDVMLAGQDVRRQKDLVGIRKLATLQFNLAVEAKDRLSEEAFMALPAVDKAVATQADALNTPARLAWLIKKKLAYGDDFEWLPAPGSPEALALETARREAASKPS